MAQDNTCRPGGTARASTQFCSSYFKEKISEFSELFANLEADCVVLRRRLKKKRAECRKAYSLKRKPIRRDISELQDLLEEKTSRLCQLRTQVRDLEEKYGEGKEEDLQEFKKDIEQCKRSCDSELEDESDGHTTCTQLGSSSEDSPTSQAHQKERMGAPCTCEHIQTPPLFTINPESDQVNREEYERSDLAITTATNLNGSPPNENIISESKCPVTSNSKASVVQVLDDLQKKSVAMTPTVLAEVDTDPVICGEAMPPAPTPPEGSSDIINQSFSHDIQPPDHSLKRTKWLGLGFAAPVLDSHSSKETSELGAQETLSREGTNATQGSSDPVKRRTVAHLRWVGEGNPPERNTVIDKVLAMGFVPPDLCAVIHPRKIPEYDISFVNPEDLSRFWEAFEQHKSEAMWLGFTEEPIFKPQVCTVTILVRNESIPVNDLTVWLSRYGDIIVAPTKTLDERKIWTGGWKCQMRLKQINNVIQHLPRSAYLGSDRILCFYNGQPKNCFKCGSGDHRSISCSVARCSRCHTTGHATCNTIRCNLCGLLGHKYSRCPQAWHNTLPRNETPQPEQENQ